MTDDFWTLAQEGHRGSWANPQFRRTKGNPEARKEYWQQLLNVLARFHKLTPEDQVVDVGCGPAGILTAIDVPCEKTGVDSLMDYLQETYDLPGDIRYIQSTGEALEFEDGFFQVVFCMNVLDHVRSPRTVWQEFCRVLKPGGILTLEVDTFERMRYWRKRFSRWRRILRRKHEKHPHTFRRQDVLNAAERLHLELLHDVVTRDRRKRVRILFLFHKPPSS